MKISEMNWMQVEDYLERDNRVGVDMPDERKPLIEQEDRVRPVGRKMRVIYGDGDYGGYYQRNDEEVMTIWESAVTETRALIEDGWD